MENSHTPTDDPLWCVGHHIDDPNLELTTAVVDGELSFGYDVISTRISNSSFQARVKATLEQAVIDKRRHIRIDSLTADEVNIAPGNHVNVAIAFVSPWIEVDSTDPLIAHASKQALDLELAYAAFCGVSQVVLPGPQSPETAAEYAQTVNEVLNHSAYMHLLVQMPTHYSSDDLSAWDTWNSIRTVCNYSSQLGLALEIKSQLPPLFITRRWFAEPVRILSISSSTFCLNAKGYPVFTKAHQQLLTMYMKIRPTPYIFLTKTDGLPTGATKTAMDAMEPHDPLAYLIYIRHLQQNQPPRSIVEKFGAGYQDYLQAPLQPLADNLESITYEVFEKDPVKYNQYEKAIQVALEDRPADSVTVVAVVGAGRGPLVTRALRAAMAASRQIRMIAVEKNPNAYVHLLGKNRDVWDNQVTVIKSDMRSWNPEFTVDILISELLGSFADNELSPECLDGVQRVLDPINGIMIPQSYSAHLTPILAPKIHADITSRKSDPDAPETPYVVMLHAIDFLAENHHIEKVWEFSHPADPAVLSEAAAFGGGFVGLGEGGNDHNLRSCKVTFKVPHRGVVHGLGGYFESVLYGNVEMSTRPDTIDFKSKDMISWFPIFFPLKTPLFLPDNSEVDVSMWRKSSDRKVWYEWVVEGFFRVGDQRFRLTGSELHSSKKNGCLM
ncbi:Skb1 methyltransferase [Ascodesmis nigricans]|uniref:Protein arginine N-methyltransferase n=1 Tax=Ascodesmis nigricans TaxID=341454 RepID=A0A4S2MIV4_9PEZI|nr:Skb1 methyltransferase [Ascodesmis nigricans]